MKQQLPKPTESELAILQILWEMGEASVREVNDRLNTIKEGEVGYTTTLKLLQIMLEKELVQRDTASRTHIYKAAVAEDAVQENLLNRFVKQAFRGSASKLVMRALGTHEPSDDELEAIKSLIKQIEQDKK